MKHLAVILLILSFFKTFYYGKFEKNVKKNSIGGNITYFIAFLGLIFPIAVLLIWY